MAAKWRWPVDNGTGGNARRLYSKPERQAALMHMRRVLDEGGTVARAATELRIPKHTLYCWREVAEGRRKPKRRGRSARPGWKPVSIVATAMPAAVTSPGIVVLGPRGLRMEGLTVASIAELVRALD
jgi:hypothetical protein